MKRILIIAVALLAFTGCYRQSQAEKEADAAYRNMVRGRVQEYYDVTVKAEGYCKKFIPEDVYATLDMSDVIDTTMYLRDIDKLKGDKLRVFGDLKMKRVRSEACVYCIEAASTISKNANVPDYWNSELVGAYVYLQYYISQHDEANEECRAAIKRALDE